jgi:hypothetical protein
MIEQIDQRLKEWVSQVVDVPIVSLSSPEQQTGERGVSCYLLDLLEKPPLRTAHLRPPLQFSLRYLITTWAADPLDAHSLLGELAFAAMQHPEFELDLSPPATEMWLAFGLTPRPSFFLRALASKHLPEPDVKLVRKPLVLQASPTTSLQGTLQSPDQVPLRGALVELPDLQLRTRTDQKGHFHFPMIPTEPHRRQIRVMVKGEEKEVTIDLSKLASEPLVIQYSPPVEEDGEA